MRISHKIYLFCALSCVVSRVCAATTTDAANPPNTSVPAVAPASSGLSFSNDWQYGHDFPDDIDQITATTMFGTENNKIQLYTNQAQFSHGTLTFAYLDIFGWHALSDKWAIKGGADYSYLPAAYWRPGAGVEGTFPLDIDVDIRSYWHADSGEVDGTFSRDTKLIGKLSLFTAVEVIAATKSLDYAQIGQGLNSVQYNIGPAYQLFPSIQLQLQYQYTRSYGDTANILKADGSGPISKLLLLGLEAVF